MTEHETPKRWLVRPYESDCEWQVTTEQPDDEMRRWFEIKPQAPQAAEGCGPSSHSNPHKESGI